MQRGELVAIEFEALRGDGGFRIACERNPERFIVKIAFDEIGDGIAAHMMLT
jgi:hypothetical protein